MREDQDQKLCWNWFQYLEETHLSYQRYQINALPWIARDTSIIIADSENANRIVDPIVIKKPKNIGRW